MQALTIEKYALSLGAETFSPSISSRVTLGIEYANKFKDDKQAFLDFVYNIIGTGVCACESVSTALLIAYYATNPNECALLCANVGGDTDTIGAIATAISGGAYGFDSIEKTSVATLIQQNDVDFEHYVQLIYSHKN